MSNKNDNFFNENEELNKKIIYLNNEIFKEKMKNYMNNFSKDDYEYYEGRIRNIKDIEKENNKCEIKEKHNEKVKDKQDLNGYKRKSSFRMRQIKKVILKLITICITLYVSPFFANALVSLGINAVFVYFLVIILIYIMISSVVAL